ncbi:hypothetical protein [Acinetobacter sp. ANC 3813]|uniref:hypothetical protein n=1 Tax=Acinetobacter sp. ANC 3813 TaxID=1977873 RepID=UPI000A33BE6B|nr:hypothetical protein [Acinetobacter sp. ANC 3813]OTG87844.1 hypothetical protein B9T34_16035 [Acinetobacter sp. ANC 3813]
MNNILLLFVFLLYFAICSLNFAETHDFAHLRGALSVELILFVMAIDFANKEMKRGANEF